MTLGRKTILKDFDLLYSKLINSLVSYLELSSVNNVNKEVPSLPLPADIILLVYTAYKDLNNLFQHICIAVTSYEVGREVFINRKQ